MKDEMMEQNQQTTAIGTSSPFVEFCGFQKSEPAT